MFARCGCEAGDNSVCEQTHLARRPARIEDHRAGVRATDELIAREILTCHDHCRRSALQTEGLQERCAARSDRTVEIGDADDVVAGLSPQPATDQNDGSLFRPDAGCDACHRVRRLAHHKPREPLDERHARPHRGATATDRSPCKRRLGWVPPTLAERERRAPATAVGITPSRVAVARKRDRRHRRRSSSGDAVVAACARSRV